jgi:hypothetical protein
MPIAPTDFGRMWIVVPPSLQDLLTAGRVLTCSHEQVQFALAMQDDLDHAFERRDQLASSRPAFVLPVTPAVLAAIAAGETIEVRVLSGPDKVVGTIRLSGERQNKLRTEHGPKDVDSIVLSQLRAGDLFAICERTRIGREWIVYRTLTDGTDGTVKAHYTVAVDQPARIFSGEDQVVFRISDRVALLEQLGWEDIYVAA